MLRIYASILTLVREMRPFCEATSRCDAALAMQMRRALTSVPLNVAERAESRGRNRAVRYQTAAGSMREVMDCLKGAVALGYVGEVDGELMRRMGVVIATLRKNVRS